MKILVLATTAFLSVAVQAANKKNLPGLLVSSQKAHALIKSKTMKDYVSFSNLTESDKKLFLEDLRKNKMLDNKIPEFTSRGTEITFKAKQNFVIDYKLFSERFLIVNGSKISIKEPISYVQAQVHLRNMMKSAYIFNPFFEVAHADITDSLRIFFGAELSSASRASELKLDGSSNIAGALIETYNNEAKYFQDYARNNNAPLFISTWQFTCVGSKLKSVEERTTFLDGEKVSIDPINTLKYYNDTIIFTSANCSSESGRDGIIRSNKATRNAALTSIHSRNAFCGAEGENIFQASRTFGFPEVAEACCKEDHCHSTVKEHWEKIAKDAQRTHGTIYTGGAGRRLKSKTSK